MGAFGTYPGRCQWKIAIVETYATCRNPFQGLHDKRRISRQNHISKGVKKINREIRRLGEPGVTGKTVQRADLDNLELTYGAETYMAFLGLAGSTYFLNIA
jgi:hypothetical protein